MPIRILLALPHNNQCVNPCIHVDFAGCSPSYVLHPLNTNSATELSYMPDVPALRPHPLLLQVGQRVFAIGNPFSLDQTLTGGLVSALGREIKGVTGDPSPAAPCCCTSNRDSLLPAVFARCTCVLDHCHIWAAVPSCACMHACMQIC